MIDINYVEEPELNNINIFDYSLLKDKKSVSKQISQIIKELFDTKTLLATPEFYNDVKYTDFFKIKQVKKLGSLGGLLKLIPGMPKITSEQTDAAEKEMKNVEVIINSMTPYERKHPEILKFSHKQRISKGCGKSPADINRVLKKYEQMKDMMKQMKSYRDKGKMPPNFGGRF